MANADIDTHGAVKSTELQAWLLVGSLFVTLFLVFGSGYNTAGVFVDPLVREFGWSRAKVSSLQTVLALSAGLSVPLVGWLLDRIEARILITVGSTLAGAGFLLASVAHSFLPMLVGYALLGLGIAGSTLLPASLVIPNWFGERRGVALGIVMAGTSVGGMVMTFVASQAIARSGWRVAYVTLAAPMFVAVAPVVLAFVRTRPAHSERPSTSDVVPEPDGLDVRQALRGRSFWLIATAQLLFTLAIAGTNLHVVPYLTGAGYAPARAALVLSAVLGLATLGKLAMGYVADRIGARMALTLNLALIACASAILPSASADGMLSAFIVLYGLSCGAPLVLLPMLLAEVSGLRRLGSLLGLTGISTVLGGAIGPMLAGRLFDATGSYNGAFYLFAVVLVVGAGAALGCKSAVGKSRQPIPVP
jgi:MFS family permease